jgi:hypothetical protein
MSTSMVMAIANAAASHRWKNRKKTRQRSPRTGKENLNSQRRTTHISNNGCKEYLDSVGKTPVPPLRSVPRRHRMDLLYTEPSLSQGDGFLLSDKCGTFNQRHWGRLLQMASTVAPFKSSIVQCRRRVLRNQRSQKSAHSGMATEGKYK